MLADPVMEAILRLTKRIEDLEVDRVSTAAPTDHNHTAGAGDGGILTNDAHDGYSDYAEIAAPGNPAADTARLFAVDDGAGQTRIRYKRSDASVRDVSDADKLQGTLIDTTAPNNLEFLRYASGTSKWTPTAPLAVDAVKLQTYAVSTVVPTTQLIMTWLASTAEWTAGRLTTLEDSTISGGVITLVGTSPIIIARVETEGAAATDNLDAIAGGISSTIVILIAYSGTHDVVVKNATVATNGLMIAGNFTLDTQADTLVLIRLGTVPYPWKELCRSNNA